MPSISRHLSDVAMHLSLSEEAAHVTRSELLEHNRRNARTLVKDGPLRVALNALAAGGHIAPHHAAGPLTVQVLSGSIRVHAAGVEHVLVEGDLLSLAAGVEHEVDSEQGGVFLLTVALETPPSPPAAA